MSYILAAWELSGVNLRGMPSDIKRGMTHVVDRPGEYRPLYFEVSPRINIYIYTHIDNIWRSLKMSNGGTLQSSHVHQMFHSKPF